MPRDVYLRALTSGKLRSVPSKSTFNSSFMYLAQLVALAQRHQVLKLRYRTYISGVLEVVAQYVPQIDLIGQR
jgi:hypothetical protein